MKSTGNFVLRTVGKETILIPCGIMTEEVGGVITLSDTAAFIYTNAQKTGSFEELVFCMGREYGIASEECREDLRETLELMKKKGMLEETDGEKGW